MGAMASQITSLSIVHLNIYSGTDQENANAPRHYTLCGSPVNSPHKWPVTRKMFPFDDVIMTCSMTVHVSEATIKYGVKMTCIYQEQYYSHTMKQNKSVSISTVDCCLVMLYGDWVLAKQWRRYWLAWRHQAVNWINVDLSSIGSSGIHLRATQKR